MLHRMLTPRSETDSFGDVPEVAENPIPALVVDNRVFNREAVRNTMARRFLDEDLASLSI